MKEWQKRTEYFAAYRSANREKARAYAAEWRKKNKEKERALTAAYRDANRETLRLRGRENYRKHSEARRRYVARYKAENKGAYRVYHANRRARMATKLSPGIVAALMDRQRGECVYCAIDIREENHIDHIMPLALGGENVDSNVQLLCPPCNMSKHATHPDKFAELRACS